MVSITAPELEKAIKYLDSEDIDITYETVADQVAMEPSHTQNQIEYNPRLKQIFDDGVEAQKVRRKAERL